MLIADQLINLLTQSLPPLLTAWPWLLDQQTCWPTGGQLAKWPAGWLTDPAMTAWLTGIADLLADSLTVMTMTAWLTGVVDRLVYWLTDSLSDHDCLTARHVRLTDWLTDWLTHLLTMIAGATKQTDCLTAVSQTAWCAKFLEFCQFLELHFSKALLIYTTMCSHFSRHLSLYLSLQEMKLCLLTLSRSTRCWMLELCTLEKSPLVHCKFNIITGFYSIING